jgi:hypothetical protein
MQRTAIQVKNPDWMRLVTSNSFIAHQLAQRDPIDVLRRGAKSVSSISLDPLVALDMGLGRNELIINAGHTGVLDTDSKYFLYAASMEATKYWFKHPIQSIRALLRNE